MQKVYSVVGNEGVNVDKKREKWLRAGIMLGSILLSTIVTIISAIKLESAEISVNGAITLESVNIGISLLLGLSTFMITELIVLVFSSMSYTRQKSEDEKFMDNISEYSHLLHDINRFYYDISKDSHGDKDLFVTYAKKEIEKLHNVLSTAANQKEFNISSDYFINADGVFDAFSQTPDKILKMTFPVMVADGKLFTSKADIHFFEVLRTEVKEGYVKSVHTLVILENESLLQREDVKKLLDFFSAENNYTCKIVFKSDFENICDTNGVSSQYIDFGIYGPKMLYITEQYLPVHKGTYYKEETKIKHYTRLFDEVWDSDFITVPNPSSNMDVIDLSSLIS